MDQDDKGVPCGGIGGGAITRGRKKKNINVLERKDKEEEKKKKNEKN